MQPVNIWRLKNRIPIARQIPKALIVGQYENDVRLRRGHRSICNGVFARKNEEADDPNAGRQHAASNVVHRFTDQCRESAFAWNSNIMELKYNSGVGRPSKSQNAR